MSKRSKPTTRRDGPPPAATAVPGTAGPASAPGTHAIVGGTPVDPVGDEDRAVEEEWRRIESSRVAEEVGEAREDLLAAIEEPDPESVDRRGRQLWVALVGALLAGVVFAVVVNVFLLAIRPETPPPSAPPSGPRPPSESERGPGVGAPEDDPSDAEEEPLPDDAPSEPAPG